MAIIICGGNIMNRGFLPAIILAALLLPAGMAQAAGDLLQSTEYQVTFDLDEQSTPTIGRDAIGDYVVYTSRPLVNGQLGASDIYYQRIENSQPVGDTVAVAVSSANEYMNDASGDYIVYRALSGYTSRIMLYQISTAQTRELTHQAGCTSPKIFGDVVVWLQASVAGVQVMTYRISSGEPVEPMAIAGPVPSAQEVQIGDRFIVWSQLVNGQSDVAAYDMQNGLSFSVSNDPGFDETAPATDGAWVVFQARNRVVYAGIAIYAVNLDTWEVREVANNGASNQRPNISGNLISYESNIPGNWDIFVYRLPEGDTFPVTTRPEDQFLSDVLGLTVAYVDNRNGNTDVFSAVLTFIPTDPCANLAGDGDGDGICTMQDNCPATPNADQSDLDGDAIGDACDNCPAVANSNQIDSDGNGIGDACEPHDFSIGPISPVAVTIGGSAATSVIVSGSSSSPVTLSVSTLPSGVLASLSPNPVTPSAAGAASLLTLSLLPVVTPSTFTLTITGTSGPLTHSTTVTVAVNATGPGITKGIEQLLAAGCINNSGVASALNSMISEGQAAISAGGTDVASNRLTAFINQVEAQSGKHIGSSCTMGGITFNPAETLINDATALISSLKGSAMRNPFGFVK